MDDNDVDKAYKTIQNYNSNIKIEVSGGITKERLKKLSTIGQMYVSIGAITTRSRAVDISIRMRKVP